LFYRSDLFKKAGIDVPTTWDEYYQAAVKIRALGGYIGNFDNTLASFFPSMWMQNGQNWFSQKKGTWTVSIDAEKNKVVADWIQRLYDKHLVTTYPGFQDEFSKALNKGQVWSQLGGPWMTPLIPGFAKDTSGKWAVAKAPVWDGSDKVGIWGGGSIAMFSGTKHPYEAAKFARWATTDPAALALNASQGGAYPPIVDVVSKVPAMQKGIPFYGDQAVFTTVEKYAGDVNAGWVWGPTMLQLDADLITEFGKTTAGHQTVFETLQALQAKTIQTMKDQGISVNK
jgi:multiple sugar transport system substrate-binding protein